MKEDCTAQHHIVVIDDDLVMRLSCRKILEKSGFWVETFEDGEKGIARIKEQTPVLLIVDLKMPKIGGLAVIKRVREIDPEICIVVITGYATVGTAVEAMKSGAYDFLPKPFTPDELRIIVNRGVEKRDLERQAKRLKIEKEKIERQFISFVSHELQSPLVAVQQYLEVLKFLGDSPEVRAQREDWIERSLKRIQQMRAIVQNWLTSSKIESGQLIETTTAVDIPPLIEDIFTCFESNVIEKNITLFSELTSCKSPVKGQEGCLRMLFSNLISNAIKYNKPNGFVRVIAREEPEILCIEVVDNGIGIAEDKLSAIFKEFYRIKNETTRSIAGTGLGLPICKKIIMELGGAIDVTSQIGEGTTFTIRLPLISRK